MRPLDAVLAALVTVLVTLGGVRAAAANDLSAMQWPTVRLTRWLLASQCTHPAGVWLWLAWANGRGYHWARPAFVAFFCVLTMVPFFGLGRDALPYTRADVIAAAVLWLVALVVMGPLQRDGQRVLPAPGQQREQQHLRTEPDGSRRTAIRTALRNPAAA